MGAALVAPAPQWDAGIANIFRYLHSNSKRMHYQSSYNKFSRVVGIVQQTIMGNHENDPYHLYSLHTNSYLPFQIPVQLFSIISSVPGLGGLCIIMTLSGAQSRVIKKRAHSCSDLTSEGVCSLVII